MFNILALVEDVILSVLLYWIEHTDLGLLDCSFCNKSLRLQFFYLIQSCMLFDGLNVKSLAQLRYFVWLGQRKLSVSRLRICDFKSCLNEVFSSNEIILSRLKVLRVEGVEVPISSPIDNVAKRCTSLEELYLKAPPNNVNFVVQAFLQFCPSINKLVVDSQACYIDDIRKDYRIVKSDGLPGSLTMEGVRSILEYGVNITELSLDNQEQLVIEESDLDDNITYNGLVKLTNISFGRCSNLKDDTFRILTKNCTKLQQVDIHLCIQLTSNAIVHIATNNSEIKLLNLACCANMSDKALLAVSQHCPHLESTNLNGTSVTDKSMIAIAQNCPNFKRVALKHNENITDATIIAFTALSNFQSIELGMFTSAMLGNIGMHNGIDVETISPITYTVLNNLINSNTKIHTLDLTDMVNIDDTIRLVSEKCPLLKWLVISHNGNVTEETMILITEHCPEIQLLDVQKCVCITDKFMTNFTSHCVKLTSLDITSCIRLTNKSVLLIAKHCSLLTEVVFDWCNISASTIVEVTLQCPRLIKLHCFGISNSTVILYAMVENSPFICDVGISEDTVVHRSFYEKACKVMDCSFPRAMICSMNMQGGPVYIPNINHL